MANITYKQLLKELNDLPDIARKIIMEDNKRELSKKRSTFLGGGRRR
jgi:hypothetical protein